MSSQNTSSQIQQTILLELRVALVRLQTLSTEELSVDGIPHMQTSVVSSTKSYLHISRLLTLKVTSTVMMNQDFHKGQLELCRATLHGIGHGEMTRNARS